MASGVNQNQGAESLLAYLISRVTMTEADDREEEEEPESASRRALKTLLNGFATSELTAP
jgi:hypothetical protein